MNAPFGHSLPRCPYCLGPMLSWPAAAVIEPCWSCRRPIVNIKNLARYSQRPRLHSLFGIISASYGLAVVALVASLAFTGMDARQFAKILTLLLFVIGSVLGVDGFLAVTTGVDRTWDCRRSGIAAKIVGIGKVAAGALALRLSSSASLCDCGDPVTTYHAGISEERRLPSLMLRLDLI